MTRDYDYLPYKRKPVSIHYIGGLTYQRVPEAAARAIIAAGAGYDGSAEAVSE